MNHSPAVTSETKSFFDALREQRWDDHRYYHHSRINQSLHFLSSICFLFAYVMLPINIVTSVLAGWILAMVLRQSGHFFFEPKGYDAANQATHEYKEAVKVGYNLFRKVILMSIWAATPIVMALSRDLFGIFDAWTTIEEFVHHVCVVWFWLGVGAVTFRMLQLFVQRDIQTGAVWVTKILTDPFHDFMIYRKAPLHLLRGELIDPIVERG